MDLSSRCKQISFGMSILKKIQECVCLRAGERIETRKSKDVEADYIKWTSEKPIVVGGYASGCGGVNLNA